MYVCKYIGIWSYKVLSKKTAQSLPADVANRVNIKNAYTYVKIVYFEICAIIIMYIFLGIHLFLSTVDETRLFSISEGLAAVALSQDCRRGGPDPSSRGSPAGARAWSSVMARCVSKNKGTPKWMVKIMENPMNKWMIWGVALFLETPESMTILCILFCVRV